MRRRACATIDIEWIGHVALVIGRVDVLAVPARREVLLSANLGAAVDELLGGQFLAQSGGLGLNAIVPDTVEAGRFGLAAILFLLIGGPRCATGDGGSLSAAEMGVSSQHPEARWESSDLGSCELVVDQEVVGGNCDDGAIRIAEHELRDPR